jgi:hypothetical protein
MKDMTLKKGQRVMVEEWIVADQSDGEILTTTGTICSNGTVHKVQGYENEYNEYVKVKLDCGNVLSFNWHELNCI